ncbi:hypothetical protein [uncultured Kordia sp.]|uniref:hypothetical protein n=1 Tax=uncultured Kordia sp. TaxID=507699 RepID=UPI00261F9F2F|nr:hypothetical protein [uncultured Kordia sp.]
MIAKPEIKYIELKSDYSYGSPAWIGSVSFSKSGRTIYFNNTAFQSLNGNGISGNYFDLETGDGYWISNLKRNKKLESTEFGDEMYAKQPNKLSTKELEFLIAKLVENEENTLYNKGRRTIKRERIVLKTKLKKRLE